MEEEKTAATPSTSLSDTAASSTKEDSSSPTVSDKELQDVDERPLLKRSTPSDVDQSDESISQSKKARLSPSQESADTSLQETSAVETDSKEDLGYVVTD